MTEPNTVSLVPSDVTRDSGHRVDPQIFRVDIRKRFFTWMNVMQS